MQAVIKILFDLVYDLSTNCMKNKYNIGKKDYAFLDKTLKQKDQ